MTEKFHQYTRAKAIVQQIEQLAAITEQSGCVTRRYGSPAFVEGAHLVAQWMQEAGLQTRIDAIGNVRGRLVSPNPHAKTLVMASHIDTVINAGKYDGPLGVLMGIDVAKQIGQSTILLPFHIEIIAFADEEGVRFHTTFLGSQVVTGAFNPQLLAKQDADGITLQQAMSVFGGTAADLPNEAIPANDWLGYFEMHIEQGPVLDNRNLPVAWVSDIAGQKRILVHLTGFAGHAGTVPMSMRQDALCAAAEMVVAIEKFALQQPNLVATVGTLQIPQSASNVIPGNVHFSIDLRSNEPDLLANAYQQLQQLCTHIAQLRNIACNWQLVQHTAPVAAHAPFTQLLQQAIAQAGFPDVSLVSGAGHDAVPISQVAPIAMLFIRCYKGISHHPDENCNDSDIAAALQVADNFLYLLIEQHT